MSTVGPQERTTKSPVQTAIIHAFDPSEVIAYGVGELDVVRARCGFIKKHDPLHKPITEGTPCPSCINVIVSRFAEML